MRKTILMMVSALLGALLLSGCNTMAGMGQDVQKAGEKVEDAAKKK